MTPKAAKAHPQVPNRFWFDTARAIQTQSRKWSLNAQSANAMQGE